MTISFPTYQEIVDRVRADIKAILPDVDPTIYGSVIRAIADSFAGRCFDIIQVQKQLIKQLMPQTATDEYLEQWAAYEDIQRIVAVSSEGLITFTGTASSVIPIGTVVQTADSKTFTTQAEAIIASTSLDVDSITRSGTIATVTTTDPHELASGMSVLISGAVENDYNGTFEITVTGEDTFIYTVLNSPTTPATGTISASGNWCSATILSDAFGLDQNLDSGASVSLMSPITGVDTVARVQFTGIVGGADDESDTALLKRILQSRAVPVANFNVGAIEKAVLAIAGNTRVWVKRVTPAIGQVTVYFVRDDDADPIPSGAELTVVEDALLEMLPAHSDPDDLFVEAPDPISTDFTFSEIIPDTATMKVAIEENLKAFFSDQVDFETTVIEDLYRAAIINTIDPDTGDTLTSFTLTDPSGDITVSSGEIAVLGTVTFPA
jgi:uncharacterized phage protein gp47/JayE